MIWNRSDVSSVARSPSIFQVGDNGTHLEDPDHWRQRAEEARGIAVDCDDLETSHLMLGLALAYDDLAERAEERRDLQLALTDRYPSNAQAIGGSSQATRARGGSV